MTNCLIAYSERLAGQQPNKALSYSGCHIQARPCIVPKADRGAHLRLNVCLRKSNQHTFEFDRKSRTNEKAKIEAVEDLVF